MPEKETIRRARKDKREGKSASTQAGEFVREEMHHIREGKHGARSAKQAIAIGLSKARRAGVKMAPPEKGEASEKTRQAAKRDYRKGQSESPKGRPSASSTRAESTPSPSVHPGRGLSSAGGEPAAATGAGLLCLQNPAAQLRNHDRAGLPRRRASGAAGR